MDEEYDLEGDVLDDLTDEEREALENPKEHAYEDYKNTEIQSLSAI